MNKMLKIQVWKAEHAMAIQVLEHSGLANIHDGVLYGKTWTLDASLNLNVFNFNSNAERDSHLKITLNNITREAFNAKPHIEECGNVITATWEEK